MTGPAGFPSHESKKKKEADCGNRRFDAQFRHVPCPRTFSINPVSIRLKSLVQSFAGERK